MSRTPRQLSQADYAAIREASGWWLRAWRDYRKLTLEELAAEVGTSKGQISDLENGKRFNRDWIERCAKALGTTGGRLLDVNPFEMWDGADQLSETIRALPAEDRAAVVGMAERLARKFDAA